MVTAWCVRLWWVPVLLVYRRLLVSTPGSCETSEGITFASYEMGNAMWVLVHLLALMFGMAQMTLPLLNLSEVLSGLRF